MNASIEISMYPLQEKYSTPILNFIQKLNEYPDIIVETNTMSTQIFGTYDALMQILTDEMRTVFEQDQTTVMVMKIINADLR